MSAHANRPGGDTEPELDYSAANLQSASMLPGISDTTQLETDLRDYLAAVYGPSTGYAHMSAGLGPRVNANGKYDFASFGSWSYAWPEDADVLVRTILQETARGQHDVYICPNLMVGDRRAKGEAVARWTVHTEVDSELDLDRVKELGGFAVASGFV